MHTRAKRNALTGLLFILPSLIGVMVFVLVPFIDAVNRSFRASFSLQFVLFRNYEAVFSNEAFKLAVGNTFRFIGICIPLLVILSLILAVLVNSVSRLSGLFKTTILVPLAIPVSSMVLVWQIVFHKYGYLSGVADFLGYGGTDWLKTDGAFWVLVATYLWRNVGYDMIIWMAGLSNISPYLYEAADIDGAGALQKFFFITLPNLRTTLFTIVVISLLNSFKVFREAYLIAGEYPHGSIYMLQHLFNNWFIALDTDKMCAGAVIIGLVTFIMILLFQRIWGEEA